MHVCVCAHVLQGSHQQVGYGVDAVDVANLTWWTTSGTGHTVSASIVSTDHFDQRTPWIQDLNFYALNINVT